jgi:2,4-dienoyl-CoA reductase-like NADH-dependent reductase (Old Yellow Enzyme family)
LHLNRRVERFLRRSGMSATRFGRTALRDPRFVFDLRRGRELRPPTEQRVAAWLDEQETGLEARLCGRG